MLVLEFISYLTAYATLETWPVFFGLYVITRAAWCVWFRYQGVDKWQLAALPFYLQFMKVKQYYGSYKLPIIYCVLSLFSWMFFPFWLVQYLLAKFITKGYYINILDTEKNINKLTFIPFYGLFYMITEVINSAGIESE